MIWKEILSVLNLLLNSPHQQWYLVKLIIVIFKQCPFYSSHIERRMQELVLKGVCAAWPFEADPNIPIEISIQCWLLCAKKMVWCTKNFNDANIWFLATSLATITKTYTIHIFITSLQTPSRLVLFAALLKRCRQDKYYIAYCSNRLLYWLSRVVITIQEYTWVHQASAICIPLSPSQMPEILHSKYRARIKNVYYRRVDLF